MLTISIQASYWVEMTYSEAPWNSVQVNTDSVISKDSMKAFFNKKVIQHSKDEMYFIFGITNPLTIGISAENQWVLFVLLSILIR